MEKYVISKEKLRADGKYESEPLKILDDYDEAFAEADELYADMTEEEKKTSIVSVGEIQEEYLDVPSDWLSYSELDILAEFPEK